MAARQDKLSQRTNAQRSSGNDSIILPVGFRTRIASVVDQTAVAGLSFDPRHCHENATASDP
jgi:hypothetical protein